MFRSILSAALVAGLGTTAFGAAVPWDWTYDANLLPGTSGSIEHNGTPWSSFSPYLNNPSKLTDSVGGGQYNASTLGTDDAAGWQYPVGSGSLAYLKSATGYTLEWRVKINTIELNNGGNGAVGLSMEDGDTNVNEWFFFGFDLTDGQYRAVLQGGNLYNATVTNIDNNMHTYRITVLGTTANLYMDGAFIGSVTDPRMDIDANIITWGDGTPDNDSSYTVDYLYATGQGAFAPVAVPEPAMLGLVALGGLAMLRRRREV